MRRLIDHPTLRLITFAVLIALVIAVGAWRQWTPESIAVMAAGIGVTYLAFWNGMRSKLPIVLLACCLALSGCGAKDARQLYGQSLATSQALHQAVISTFEAAEAAGVPQPKRQALAEQVTPILSEYRSAVAMLKSYSQAMDAAEKAGDPGSVEVANAKAKAQAQVAAEIAHRITALLLKDGDQ